METREGRWGQSVAVIDPDRAVRSCLVEWLKEANVEVHVSSLGFGELEYVTVGVVGGLDPQQVAAIVAAAVERNRPPIIIVINETLASALQRIRGSGPTNQTATDQLTVLGWARVINRLVRGLLFDGAPPRVDDSAPAQVPGLAALTPRERQVLRFVVAGADNLKIAAHLAIRERTVKAHVSNLFRKFNCENRVQLAMRASRLGIQPAIEF
jgi:DNA-binding NarL/FixJ family response regulator